MELHFKYYDKVSIVDRRVQQDADVDEDDEYDIYLKRLEGGLFTLQLIDYIILEVCDSGTPSIKQRVLHILNL